MGWIQLDFSLRSPADNPHPFYTAFMHTDLADS